MTKKELRGLIRGYCLLSGMYEQASKKGLGLEATEEAIELLIERGRVLVQTTNTGDHYLEVIESLY